MTSDTLQPTAPIIPSQTKAARALLGWTQQDLAQRATVAVSTIADFERDKRQPVLNNLEAVRSALENAGISFLPGGAVLGRPPRVAAPEGHSNPGAPIRWVEATDLVHWAERRDAQELFPELISRLILATTQTVTKRLQFRSGDSIQQEGWDGICQLDGHAPSAWLPPGISGWELGTQRSNIAAKATKDYEKRSLEPGELDPTRTTFVFATLQRWSRGSKWAKDRKAGNKWVDVRVLDADDLVQWLDLYPMVSYWLAVQIGKRPAGVLQLQEIWDEWRASTRWRMTPEIMLAGRDQQATSILNWLYRAPAAHAVQADSSQEAMAFLYAAIDQLPEPYRKFYLSRCLAATSAESARLLGSGPAPLVIILDNGEPGLATRLAELGHHVYLTFGSTVGTPEAVTRLPRPPREAFTDALTRMGVPEDEVDGIARDSARSFSVLRRLVPSAPESQPPAWANSDAARALLPALFAGAWNSEQPDDRAVLERLAGTTYEAIDREFARYIGLPDSPLRRAGSTWKIASPKDAWLRLAPFISASDLDRFSEAAHQVLAELDPRFDLEPEKRWLAGLNKQLPKHSELLLSGLSETLLLLALYGDQVQSVANASSFADRIVFDLLNDADERRWWSVSAQLQTLAEAAPEVFLDAVDASLARGDRPVMALFIEDGGPFGAANHSNLLWALETLAWNPSYFARVVQLLAHLARLDPGGRYANRPKNTLRDLFLLWYPQTHATLEERIHVLDRMRKSEPAVAWGLMLSVIPSGHDSASPAAQPRWRDFSIEDSEVITNALIYRGAVAIAERLVEDVGSDPGRWTQLIEAYPNMAPESRVTVLATLSRMVAMLSDDEARERIWAALRKLLHHHRSFPDADWALPAAELDQIDALYTALNPVSIYHRLGWLFRVGGIAELPRPFGNDWDANERALAQFQRDAIAELYASGGVSALLEMARVLEMPHCLGFAVGKSLQDSDAIDAVLGQAFREAHASAAQFANGLIASAHARFGSTWSTALLERGRAAAWPSEHFAQVLLALPLDMVTWDLAASFGDAVKAAYWRRVPAYVAHGEEAASAIAIETLVDIGRARDAVQLIASTRGNLDSALLTRALREATKQPWPDSPGNDATMFQWGVEQVLQRLDKAGDVLDEELAKLEWIYLALLEHSRRPPVVLHRFMATKPEFFVQVISTVFKPAPESGIEEQPLDEHAKSIATQAFRLLDSWKQVPGLTDGVVNEQALHHWVGQVHALCEKAGRTAIGDQYIGRVLAYAPLGEDGSWPPIAVRELIEKMRNHHIETGTVQGVHAKRGVTMRGMLDGGIQERSLAQSYREWSDATKLEWPRTSSLLNRIARSFEEDARRHDESAERTDWSN